MSQPSRQLATFMCEKGEKTAGADCVPGGNPCWERTVGADLGNAPATHYPAIALAEALDHLNTAWRLRNGKENPLVRLEAATVVAGLALDATGQDEFKARVDDLADAIDRFTVADSLPPEPDKRDDGSLNHLEAWARCELREEKQASAVDAITKLRLVRNVRRSFAHANRRHELGRYLSALGAEHPITDHHIAWVQIRSVTIQALNQLTRALAD